jgi:hypothetical protein
MGLFGFGGKKEKTVTASKNDKISFTGGSDAVTAKCILTAGIRGVEMDINLSGDSANLSHGPVSAKGESAIVTYFDKKGVGQSLRPKKARTLGDQNYWMDVSYQYLDKGENVTKVLTALDKTLANQEFIAGPLSLADPVVAGSVIALKRAGSCPSGLSNVEAWLGRVEQKIPENLRSSYLAKLS